jgi:hypothetical protein
MPEISRFFGIVITMFIDDHNPPHFHIRYGSYRAVYDLKKGIVTGQMPANVIKKVAEWADLHKTELIENWEKLKNNENAKYIQPLM